MLAVALAVAGVFSAEPVVAQNGSPGTTTPQRQRRAVPSDSYFNMFRVYNEGDFDDALKNFLREGRGAIKAGPGNRWIDSICYHTMAGECHYKMGSLDEALKHYTSALDLFAAYSDWMLRVRFDPIRAAQAGQIRAAPWGRSQRTARLGQFPRSTLIAQGRIDNNEQVRQGGVVQSAILFPVNPQEVVRCTTLALLRRSELMGPSSEHSQLTKDVLAALTRRPTQPNSWSEAWIDVQLGAAYLAAGKTEQAEVVLQRALLAGGEYDHPMTSRALLELGRLAMRAGHFDKAAVLFEEASYSAYQYLERPEQDIDLLEEIFRNATLNHILSNKPGIYPALEPAAQWARVKHYRYLHASLLLLAAENYTHLGQGDKSEPLLTEAMRAMGNRAMGQGVLGARYAFLAAGSAYQKGDVAAGRNALGKCLTFQQQGSHWLFHIRLADSLYRSGAITDRVAMTLYQQLLREPLPEDWAFRPLESLSVLTVPHPASLENWFRVALSRKQQDVAIEITDLARRHRFFSSLEMGGRLLALRWILEGPTALLDRQASVQRADLLTQFPRYNELSQLEVQVNEKLQQMPLVIQDRMARRQQEDLFEQLIGISSEKEIILRNMAVRRVPSSMVFPPVRTVKSVQDDLPDHHAVLGFYAASDFIYGYLITDDGFGVWQIGTPKLVYSRVVPMLRDLGNMEVNRVLSDKDLADTSWQVSSQNLMEELLKAAKTDFPADFEELIIVPDGVLWHVPFGALEIVDGGQPKTLLSMLRIRTVPMLSLAVGDPRGRRKTTRSAVVVGKLFPRDDDQIALEAFDELSRVLPGAEALVSPLPAPSSAYATLFDGLIVLDDSQTADTPPFASAPVTLDAQTLGSSLANWIELPYGGPAYMILPGFHTASENALKRRNLETVGQDLFLSVMGMMASGAQTVLLSTWRNGGETSFDLVREFAMELPHSTAAEAWQRSVLLSKDSLLDAEAEPRVDLRSSDNPPKADHPFFWAGYLLIDTGLEPQAAPAEAALEAALPAQQ
jgi:tetratricopeptide (TPR) repeat protein